MVPLKTKALVKKPALFLIATVDHQYLSQEIAFTIKVKVNHFLITDQYRVTIFLILHY